MTGAAELGEDMRAAAELLVAMGDPRAELELRRQLVREAYIAGRDVGWCQGYESAHAEMAQRWREIARPVARGALTHRELERRRWTVRGEPRDRQAFGAPHRDDRGSLPGTGGAS